MGDRRMISKQITDSDAFLDMPCSTQCLYFHLLQRADDDGFVGCPKKIQRCIGATDDDLKLLIAKAFLIPFDSGIVVIKHWRIHNYIQKDRYKPTAYIEEKQMLNIKDNGSYTVCIQDVSTLDTQVKLSKDKLSKDKLIEDRPLAHHKFGSYSNVLLTQEDYALWHSECPQAEQYIENLSAYMASTGKSYKNHLATLRNWYRKDAEKGSVPAAKQEASYNLDEIQSKVETQKIKYERKS